MAAIQTPLLMEASASSLPLELDYGYKEKTKKTDELEHKETSMHFALRFLMCWKSTSYRKPFNFSQKRCLPPHSPKQNYSSNHSYVDGK
jgi:hypothetical protein